MVIVKVVDNVSVYVSASVDVVAIFDAGVDVGVICHITVTNTVCFYVSINTSVDY